MKQKSKNIAVIDLFAGPGGLGEGFSSCISNSPFQIAMSVEYEKYAHETLTLRSLYRKLSQKELREYYYPYICSIDANEKKRNFEWLKQNCKKKWLEAKDETLGVPHALGNPEKWRKIKEGVALTDEDENPTNDELAILDRINEIKANHDGPLIVIGGPPCQAYSVNGRNRIRAERYYSPENDERFFLYQEYLKVLDCANPDIFVMENVEGILSAKLADGEGIFHKIKKELIRPDRKRNEQYDIYSIIKEPDVVASESHGPKYFDDHDYVIKASDYGVPQGRKRVILFGIKHKFGPIKTFMESSGNPPPTAGDLLAKLPKLRSGISNKADGPDTQMNWLDNWSNNRNELIEIVSSDSEVQHVVKRLLSAKNKKSISRDSLFSSAEIENEKLILSNRVKDSFSKTLRELERLESDKFVADNDGKGNDFFCRSSQNEETFSSSFKTEHKELFEWLNSELPGAANHMSRGHMKEDLRRYMFSASWSKAHSGYGSPFPKSKDFPKALSPEHKNWETGDHADRFRTIGAKMIPLTITSHLRKDGHAQIHFDPAQNRSLTVREAARIQTFPDDYYFEGPKGWQYQQVGNAVPSFLAKKIALYLLDVIKQKELIN